MEEGLESEEEAEVRDSTPVSTRDLIQGSGEVVVDTVSTRMVEVVVTAHMEVGMEGMAAMATDMAIMDKDVGLTLVVADTAVDAVLGPARAIPVICLWGLFRIMVAPTLTSNTRLAGGNLSNSNPVVSWGTLLRTRGGLNTRTRGAPSRSMGEGPRQWGGFIPSLTQARRRVHRGVTPVG